MQKDFPSRREFSEKAIAHKMLDGFVAEGSKGEELIFQIIGQQINQISLKALISITNLISILVQIDFPRNYKRRRDLIIKWYDDNHERIESVKHVLKFSCIYNQDLISM